MRLTNCHWLNGHMHHSGLAMLLQCGGLRPRWLGFHWKLWMVYLLQDRAIIADKANHYSAKISGKDLHCTAQKFVDITILGQDKNFSGMSQASWEITVRTSEAIVLSRMSFWTSGQTVSLPWSPASWKTLFWEWHVRSFWCEYRRCTFRGTWLHIISV